MSFRTLAFGDLESGIWGAAWELDGRPALAVIGDVGSGRVVTPALTITGAGDQEPWQLTGEGVVLVLSDEGEPSALREGFDQLVSVIGRIELGELQTELETTGRRSSRAPFDPSSFDSIREASAWFGPELGLSVLAARPRGATSHAEDLISGSVFDRGSSLRVVEPRLSTTYDAAGLPIRSGLELWLERQPRGEEEDPDEEPYELRGERVERIPRRAAGEALGSRGDAADASLSMHAELFRWHARDREGAGVYVLARPTAYQ
jgi:hypothetical protein